MFSYITYKHIQNTYIFAGQYIYAYMHAYEYIYVCVCLGVYPHIHWSVQYQACYSRGHGTERIVDQ